MKNKKLTNPLNAILTLVFTLGALALALYKGVSVVFPLLGLIAILFEQWSLNLVPDNDISSQKDEKEKMVNDLYTNPKGFVGGRLSSGLTMPPVSNIKLEESRRLIPATWLTAFVIYWPVIITAEDKLDYSGPMRFSGYLPIFALMALGLAWDIWSAKKRKKENA